MQVALGLVRQAAQALAGLGALGDARGKAPGPLDHLVIGDAGK